MMAAFIRRVCSKKTTRQLSVSQPNPNILSSPSTLQSSPSTLLLFRRGIASKLFVGDEAEKAITEMNGKPLNGRVIFVDRAKPRTGFDGGMPIARGPLKQQETSDYCHNSCSIPVKKNWILEREIVANGLSVNFGVVTLSSSWSNFKIFETPLLMAWASKGLI